MAGWTAEDFKNIAKKIGSSPPIQGVKEVAGPVVGKMRAAGEEVASGVKALTRKDMPAGDDAISKTGLKLKQEAKARAKKYIGAK